LEVLAKAAKIRPSIELRNEAIASMTLTDLRTIKRKVFTPHTFFNMDSTLERYAVAAQDGTLSIRRLSDDRELAHLASVGAALSGGPEFTPDGKLLCVAYSDGVVRIWDLESSAVLMSARGSPWAFNSSSKRLATFEHTEISLYNVPSGKKLQAFSLRPVSFAGMSRLGFDPSGRLLAASSEAQTNVLVLDTEPGSIPMTLPHASIVYGLAWHPDGRHLATACDDNLLYIWDTVTGERVKTLQGHQNSALSVAFTHDGSLLASSGWDKVRLWDFASGRHLLSIDVGGILTCFGPDDRRLGSLGWIRLRSPGVGLWQSRAYAS
jgi:WD40 repeat protein